MDFSIQLAGLKNGNNEFKYELGDAFFADMDEAIAKCEAAGLKLTQKGLYGDGSGIYAYFDGMDTVKCFVELLHSF